MAASSHVIYMKPVLGFIGPDFSCKGLFLPRIFRDLQVLHIFFIVRGSKCSFYFKASFYFKVFALVTCNRVFWLVLRIFKFQVLGVPVHNSMGNVCNTFENIYSFAKIASDTAENEPSQGCRNMERGSGFSFSFVTRLGAFSCTFLCSRVLFFLRI